MVESTPECPEFQPLSTPRLRLDLIPSRRAEEWFHLRRKSGADRFHRWTPVDVLEVHWFLQSFSRNGKVIPGEWKQLGIYLKEDDNLIGDCGFRRESNGEAEIGYTLAPEFRRRGFTTEAVEALIDCLFTRMGTRRITARTIAENRPSLGLLKKLGFHLDKDAGETISLNGKETPVLMFYRDSDER